MTICRPCNRVIAVPEVNRNDVGSVVLPQVPVDHVDGQSAFAARAG